MRCRWWLVLGSSLVLGCAHVRAREAIAALESDCAGGDSLACLAAAKYWTVAGDSKRAAMLESHSCRVQDGLEACHRLGVRQLAAGWSSGWSTLHRACLHGLEPSCEVLRRAVATSMLDHHPWVWECLAAADPALGSIGIELSFTNTRPQGPATAVIERLDTSDTELRQCLDEVFAATDFGGLRYGEFVRFRYVASLDPEHVASRLESARYGHERVRIDDADQQPPPDACLEGTSSNCAVVPLDQLANHMVYIPSMDTRALRIPRSATAPRSLEVSMVFCVDPLTGKINQVDALSDAVEPELVEALAAQIRVWRVKPWWIDGARVEVCSARTFDIEVRWSIY